MRGLGDGANVAPILPATLGAVILIFLVTVLVGLIGDEVQRASVSVSNDSVASNVSSSAIAILDLARVFLGLLVLGGVAVVVPLAFR